MKQIEVAPAVEFSNQQAAAYLGISAYTLEIWRCTQRHKIRYFKVGRRIRYRQADLDAWLASRACEESVPA